MINYIIRRLLIAIPVLLGITIINFIIVYMSPGNPVETLIDPNMSPAQIEAQKEKLGLNAPLYIQYINWLTNLLQGNLGFSLVTYEPVLDIIIERLGPTILLMGISLVFGLIVAIPLGIISATKQSSKLDYIASGAAFAGVSIPNFFLALILIYLFSFQINIFPSGGMKTLGSEGGFIDSIMHLALPVMVMATFLAGKFIRYVRASVLETLGEDYLRTARAKGLKEFVVINKHALRNALIPIITIIGLEIPILVGGAVVTEQVFSWPGIGSLTITAITTRDYTLLMGINLIIAVAVLTTNLITDIVYSWTDPRIKYK